MSFQAAALFVKWGDAKAAEFFRALKDNGAVIAAGNSDVKNRVADGRVTLDGTLPQESLIPIAVRLSESVDGVVDVTHHLRAGSETTAGAPGR